jgi:flagellar protein FliS
MYARAAVAYRQVDLESASKPEILTRLFNRFLDDLSRASAAIEARDIHTKAALLDHAQRIVVELRAALDHTQGPELCANLDALYQFVADQVTAANCQLATAPLGAAVQVMTDLRDAFAAARSQP